MFLNPKLRKFRRSLLYSEPSGKYGQHILHWLLQEHQRIINAVSPPLPGIRMPSPDKKRIRDTRLDLTDHRADDLAFGKSVETPEGMRQSAGQCKWRDSHEHHTDHADVVAERGIPRSHQNRAYDIEQDAPWGTFPQSSGSVKCFVTDRSSHRTAFSYEACASFVFP